MILREEFHKQLEELNRHVSQMGHQVLEAIHNGVRSYTEQNVELAQQVVENDSKINHAEIKLEQACTRLIALQQPNTTDLRAIVTAMKVCSDLERMGDHAVAIAKTTIRVKGNPRIPGSDKVLAEAGEYVEQMLRESLDNLHKLDITAAKETAKYDEKVNHLFVVANELAIAEMKKKPEMVFNGSGFISVMGNIERIGDYVTNICERIIYIETGELVELG